MRWIEHVLPVVRAGFPFVKLLLRTVQFPGNLEDTPVIICIFQGTGYIFMNTYVIWNISEGIVIFVTETTCRTGLRVNVFCAVDNAVI